MAIKNLMEDNGHGPKCQDVGTESPLTDILYLNTLLKT